jgi:methyl-accepting chemotaxis protein
LLVSAHEPRRAGHSIKSRLYAIIGFLGLLPVLGAAFALFAIVNSTHDNAALDRAASGTIHLERINRFVYAAVMESRGIYMSPDWVTAEPFATNLMKDLSSLREVAQMWHNEAIEAQKANVDELALRVAEFVRFRTELVRLGKEESTAAARAYGDNDANRKVRSALNDSLSTLARAYEQEMARARSKIEADQSWFVIALSALAGVGFLALCGGIALVRSGLLLPLSRVRQSMLRLAQGDLESDPDSCRRAVEIVEMEQAIGVFAPA